MRIKKGRSLTVLFAFLVLLQIIWLSTLLAKSENVEAMNKREQLSERRLKNFYFAKAPSNPNVYQTITSFSDSDLTKPAGKIEPNSQIAIKQVATNKAGTPVFQLKNGTYAAASYRYFYNDEVLSQKPFKKVKTYWTSDQVKVYPSPYVVGTGTKKTSLASYSKIKVSQKATTSHGTYLFVEGQGWLDERSLSAEDKRIEAVQKLLNQKYKDASKYSIYVKQLDNQKTAQINADKSMYSASVSKLPLLYYVQQQLDEHKITGNQALSYVPDVNSFNSAYKPEGSGVLSKSADNKAYSVTDLEKKVTQYSDNVATNILGYYVAKQYNKDFQKTIKAAIGQEWNMKDRQVSAKTAGKMMEAIYKQNGEIINYLSSTDYDNQRISKDLPVKVAHKIGDAYDYRHDVAIVYGETPFILSIFTENASYDEITAIADDVYGILK